MNEYDLINHIFHILKEKSWGKNHYNFSLHNNEYLKKKRSCGRATSQGYFPRLVISHFIVITFIVYIVNGF